MFTSSSLTKTLAKFLIARKSIKPWSALMLVIFLFVIFYLINKDAFIETANKSFYAVNNFLNGVIASAKNHLAGIVAANKDLLVIIIFLFIVAGCGWIFYQYRKWISKCPACKEPWKNQLIDKTFLGTASTRYDVQSGHVVHANRYLEKYRCRNCGHLWNRQIQN